MINKGFAIHRTVKYFGRGEKYYLGILPNLKILWFCNYKVASTTLKGVFAAWDRDFYIGGPIPYDERFFGSWFKVGFWRHPVDRYCSGYVDKVLNEGKLNGSGPYHIWRMREDPGKFVEFLSEGFLAQDKHFQPQHEQCPIGMLDYLGHINTVSTDMMAIKGMGRPRGTKLPRLNASGQINPHVAHLENALKVFFGVFDSTELDQYNNAKWGYQ